MSRWISSSWPSSFWRRPGSNLGYDRHDPAGRDCGNSRNGTRAKTVLTEIGPVEIEVPRDIDSSFEPQIVRKRQRRLTGVDEIVLSLSAKGSPSYALLNISVRAAVSVSTTTAPPLRSEAWLGSAMSRRRSNDHWLVRMGERIMRVGAELSEGRVPRPLCLADEYALFIVIRNTVPPQQSDLSDDFPGLLHPKDVFGYEPDFDDATIQTPDGKSW